MSAIKNDPGAWRRRDRGLVVCSGEHDDGAKGQGHADIGSDSTTPVPAQPSARVWGRRDLSWRDDGGALVLCAAGAELLCVVSGTRFESMWRVACHGKLSDMKNVSWAKDCAASLALAILNRPKPAQETGAKAPPIAPGGSAAATPPGAAGRISEAPPAEDRPAAVTEATPSRDHVGTTG